MKKIRVLSVFGTRPEAIKMAPLVLKLREQSEIESSVCVTAQHRDMLDSVLSVFGIEPDFDLDIMSSGQTLADITSRILYGISEAFDMAKPDLVLVHGDTGTSFAAALAAFYRGILVGHVEAGLRSFDRLSPFPEEMNRRLNSQLACLHFAPTERNRKNLMREGVDGEIYVTGNTVIDALAYTAAESDVSLDSSISDIRQFDGRIITLTCHRRENYGQPMHNIFTAVKKIAEINPNVLIIYPVHPNPIVKDAAYGLLSKTPNVRLIEPLDAVDMHKLIAQSYLVLTDSGGIQEEAPALGKPVLVLRRETERPEAIDYGTVKLAGTDCDEIFRLTSDLLTNTDSYNAMAHAVNPYGDGHACERIVEAILHHFGKRAERPSDFCAGAKKN